MKHLRSASCVSCALESAHMHGEIVLWSAVWGHLDRNPWAESTQSLHAGIANLGVTGN